jgi:hypothetical protein
MLATKSDLAEISDHDSLRYALICKEVLFTLDDMPTSLPLLLLTFCMNIRIFFKQRYPQGYLLCEELSTKLI